MCRALAALIPPRRAAGPLSSPRPRSAGERPRAAGPDPQQVTLSLHFPSHGVIYVNGSNERKRLAAGEALEQALQRGDDGLLVEAVVHLPTLLADAHQAGAA